MDALLKVTDARDGFALMLLERIEALEERASRCESQLEEQITKEIMTFVRYYAYRKLQAGATHYYAYLLEQLTSWSECSGFVAESARERGKSYMLKYMRCDEWGIVPASIYGRIGEFLSSMSRDQKKEFMDAWLFNAIGELADIEKRKKRYTEVVSTSRHGAADYVAKPEI